MRFSYTAMFRNCLEVWSMNYHHFTHTRACTHTHTHTHTPARHTKAHKSWDESITHLTTSASPCSSRGLQHTPACCRPVLPPPCTALPAPHCLHGERVLSALRGPQSGLRGPGQHAVKEGGRKQGRVHRAATESMQK